MLILRPSPRGQSNARRRSRSPTRVLFARSCPPERCKHQTLRSPSGVNGINITGASQSPGPTMQVDHSTGVSLQKNVQGAEGRKAVAEQYNRTIESNPGRTLGVVMRPVGFLLMPAGPKPIVEGRGGSSASGRARGGAQTMRTGPRQPPPLLAQNQWPWPLPSQEVRPASKGRPRPATRRLD